MRTIYVVGVLLLCLVVVIFTNDSKESGANIGTDVSWPNCKIEKPQYNKWGIVGVTGGKSFTPNPCLKKQHAWFNSADLYINTGYPGNSSTRRFSSSPLQCAIEDETCLAYNYGYNAAKYAVEYAKSQFIGAPHWWLDVELGNSWSENPSVNRAAIQGGADAIVFYEPLSKVGYYSYPPQWSRITNDWKPGNPAWVATPETELSAAISYCKEDSFSGGQVSMVQYVDGLDLNFDCTGKR